MALETVLLIVVLLSGFYMAWSIGANDVSNAMGTSVGSGALTLRQAVIIAAVLEFCGAFFFGSHVSGTMQKGILDPEMFALMPQTLVLGMLSALLSAGTWLIFASYFGWPVSTTHTIVGAIIGFASVAAGLDSVQWINVGYIISSWVLSPLFGGLVSFSIFTLLRRRIFYTTNPIRAAKTLTPVILFIVVAVMSLIVIFKGIHNVETSITFAQAVEYSTFLGVAAAFIGFFLLRRIKDIKSHPPITPSYDPEISEDLLKAKKHLLQVSSATKGEMNYQVSLLLDEVDGLTSSLEESVKETVKDSQYATVEKIFGYLQILSASMMAFAHGANDVANAIGPLAAAVDVLTTGVVSAEAGIPTWLLALGGVGIIIGLATWGWRVIETIGKKITELTPTRGFAAEFGAALTILWASRIGMPVSTTHTLVGSVIGVGMAGGIEALDLSTTRYIAISWVVTVPAGAVISIIIFNIVSVIFGT